VILPLDFEIRVIQCKLYWFIIDKIDIEFHRNWCSL